MDQAKEYLAILQKYHFWVISVLLVIVGLVGWKMGVGVLEEKYTQNRGQIQVAFQQAGGVRGVNPHPNRSFIEVIDTEHDQIKAEALQAWQLHYDRQQEVLIWPREMLTNNLVDAIERLQPKGDIPERLRSDFEIKASGIPLSWTKKYNLMREVPKDPIDDEEEDKEEETTYTGVVIWEGLEGLDQRYHWGDTPRTDEILLAQEDFWMYEILLEIIVATNSGATEHYNAPIRQIVALEIAQQALLAPEITIENALMESERRRKDSKPKDSEVSVPAKGDDEKMQLAGRYVDEAKGTPLPNGPKANAVYKLMPIRMLLLMDQKKVTQLCVACANSPVMVEPRQVVIIDEEDFQGGSGGGSAGGMPLQPGPNACYVDLRGVVYLFNPPDQKRLQPADAGNTPVAATGTNPSGA